MKRSSRNTTGITGVRPHGNRFIAAICVNGVNLHLGCFDTLEDAADAKKAEIKYDFHTNHGRTN